MSCFSQTMSQVGKTRIFARLTGKGTQLLVYQMEYESEKPAAIIIPLPIAVPGDESSVFFLDMKGYEGFFRDMHQGFPAIHLPNIPKGASGKSLAVQKVGDFIASFVPTMDDFSKLDPQFVIPKETWAKVPAYADYGFAVFQLTELRGRPHPIALEFQTRMPDQVFYPTLHIHDGVVRKRIFYKHELYLQHAAYDSRVGEYISGHYADNATGFVRSKNVAGSFCKCDETRGVVIPELLIHRIDVLGPLPNKDMVFPVDGNPVVRPIDFRPIKAMAPWGAVVGGISWLIYRRNRVSGKQSPVVVGDGPEATP